MKQLKKMTSLLLAVCMTVGMFVFSPASVLADSDAIYLCDLPYTSVGCPVHAGGAITCTYSDSTSYTFSKSIRQDTVDNINGGLAMSSMTFDVPQSLTYGGTFHTYLGMQSGDSYRYGTVIFRVYIDGVEKATSAVISYNTALTDGVPPELTCDIPSTAKKITLATDCYNNTACDWSIWGDPMITPKADPTVYCDSLTETAANVLIMKKGTYAIRYDTSSVQSFSHALFTHACSPGNVSTLTYDVSAYSANGAVFRTYVGICDEYSGGKNSGRGLVTFKVYADGALLKNTGEVGCTSPLTDMTVYIPAGTKTLKFEIDPGTTNDSDWAMWGDPRVTPCESSTVYVGKLTATFTNASYGKGTGTYDMVYSSGTVANFDDSMFIHCNPGTVARPYATFDISAYTGQDMTFSSYVGIRYTNGTQTNTTYKGKVSFLVYADDVLLTQSGEITPALALTKISAVIPAGTKKLRLEVDSCGTTQWSHDTDWALFGTPTLSSEGYSATASCNKMLITDTAQISTGIYFGNGIYADAEDVSATYTSSDEDVFTVSSDGYVTAMSDGTANVTCNITYGGKTFKKVLALTVGTVDVERYLSDMTAKNVTTGVGTIYLDKGLDGKALNFLNAGNPLTFDKGVMAHANSHAEYDISNLGVKKFSATLGINCNTGFSTSSSSSATFRVYADSELIYESSELKINSEAVNINLDIPAGTQTLILETDGGTKIDCDHTTWANAKIVCDGDWENYIKTITLTADKERIAIDGTAQTSVSAVLNSGSPLDLSQAKVVYQSSDSGVLTVDSTGLVTACGNGRANVICSITYHKKTSSQTLQFLCGDTPDNFYRYLSDMQYLSATTGYGNVGIDKDIDGNKIHFRNNGSPVEYDKGIFAHAASSVEYDIEGLRAVSFESYVGINDSKNKSDCGSVIFYVYADGVQIASTDVVLLNDEVHKITATIPDGTKKLKLVADPNGSIDSDHSAWADAKIAIDGRYAKNIAKLNLSVGTDIMMAGGHTQASVHGVYADGTAFTSENVDVTYESTDTSVLTVDENGLVTAVFDGIADLRATVTGEVNTATATKNIIVGREVEGQVFGVASPDGTREAIFYLNSDGALNYSALKNGNADIPMSSLGYDTSIADFRSGLTYISAGAVQEIDETYTLTAHTRSQYHNHANERTLTFSKDGAQMKIIARAYNDGIAIRYELSSSDVTSFSINNEKTEMKLSPSAHIWAMPYTTALEGTYLEYTVNSLSGSYCLPFIVDNGNDNYVMATEADFNPEYSGSKASYSGSSSLVIGKTIADSTAITVNSPFVSAWKIFITGSLGEVSQSSMVTDVSPSHDENIDYSFVTSGISSWSWLSTGFSGQSNPDVHKKYIDYAAEMGWQYYTLDYGWQKPDGDVYDGNYTVKAGVYYDWTEEIINYAKARGIKLIAWVHKSNLLDETKMNAILESYAEIGISGIKADFFDSESVEIMALYDKLYKKCAELGLVVNCHGANKSTGEVREYPNVLAREGIRGDEYASYPGGMQTQQYTIIPFTRAVCGPADVTENIVPRVNNTTTSGSQVALSTLVMSGIHFFSTSVEAMAASPLKELYKIFPAVWDESKFIDGKIGEYTYIARRNGEVWYLAGISVPQKTAVISLDFLSDGNYLAEIYKDGDKMTIAKDTKIYTKNDTISLAMLANGGFTVKFIPLAGKVGPDTVTLDKDSITIAKGSTGTLTATASGENMTFDKVLFISSNQNVVVTSDGKITAVNAGVASVSASSPIDSGIYDECAVYVKRSENAVSAINITTPAKCTTGSTAKISFTTANIGNFKIYDSDFNEIAKTVNKTASGEGYLYEVSFVPERGGVYSINSADGLELGFFELKTDITVKFDGTDDDVYTTGEVITLPTKSDNGNNMFIGWNYDGKTYAGGMSFTLPKDKSEINLVSVYTDKTVEVDVYLNTKNGSDNNSGYASNVPLLTVDKAFEILNTYSCTTKKIIISGEFTAPSKLPENSSMITFEGENGASFNVNSAGTVLTGPITLQNIKLINNTANKFIDTIGNKFVVGKNVDTDSTVKTILIHSGTMAKSGGKEDVTVESGTVTIYAGAFYNVTATDDTAGAEYTVNGGNVTLVFRADSFASTHHGVNFTENVDIVHNGGTLSISVSSNDTQTVAFSKAVTVIENNGCTASLGNLADYAVNGYYLINSAPGGKCAPTATAGTVSVEASDGMNPFIGNTAVSGSFTVQSGKAVNVIYYPNGEAMIGSSVYGDIYEAVSAAQSGDTIKLINNITLENALSLGIDATLELNGFNLSGSGIVMGLGVSVVSDSDIADTVSACDGHFAAKGTDGGKYIYRCTDSYHDGNSLYLADGKMNITGSGTNLTLTYEKNSVSYSFGFTPAESAKIYGKGNSDITLESGNITDIYGTTDGTSASIIIKGGSISGGIYAGYDNTADIAGYTVTISGGSVGNIYAGAYSDSKNTKTVNAQITLSGGTVGHIYATGIAADGKTSTVGTAKIIVGRAVFTDIVKSSGDGALTENITVEGTNGNVFTGWNDSGKAAFTTLSIYGMQIRTMGIQGLRFIAQLGGCQSNIKKYGLLVIPENMLDGDLTLDTPSAADVNSTQSGFKTFAKNADYTRYTACLINIDAKRYDRNYTVRAYAVYEIDGVEHTVYSDAVTSSIVDTVKGLKRQYPGQYDDLYNTIMSDYSATFVSAGEFKEKLCEYADSAYGPVDTQFTVNTVVTTAANAESTLSGWSSTDYIDVNGRKIVQYALAVNPALYSLAFFGEDKTFISGVTSSTATDTYTTAIYNIAVPDNAKYVRFANYTGTGSDGFTAMHASLCDDVGAKLTSYINSKDTTDFSGKKIVCMGDSLTYGDYGTTVPGKGYPHTENYPYYLNKFLGVDVQWYAWGGYTASALASDYSDGVFSGKLGKNISVKDADYVIIMLGTNGGLTLSDNKNYTAYYNLVESIKDDIKMGGKIILCTPPHATEDSTKVNYGYMPNITNAYPEVYNIAKACGVTVFDVYRDSGLSADNESLFQPNDGLHYGGIGYASLAAFIGNELKLLANGRMSAMNLSEQEAANDKAFLDTIEYPSYEICDGKYYTLGRWFKKDIDGVSHDVTVTDGAELYFLTSGSLSFTVDFTMITEKSTPYYAVSIDGGDPMRHLITDNTVTLPDTSRHAVRLIMDGLTETEDKWSGEVGFAIKNISVNSGSLRAIRPTNDIIFYYGDSITEGINSLGTTAASPSNSASHSYAYYSAKELDAIPYFVGYGATGLLSGGSFNTMINAIDYLSDGRSVSDGVLPKEIVINHGHNDASYSSSDFCTALRAALNRLCEKYPDTKIYYAIPFAQYHADDIRMVCAEYDNVKVIETKDYGLTYSDGIHPNDAGACLAGEKIAEAITKYRLATKEFTKYTYYRKSLQNTYSKLANDKELTIAYFGGSVTAGYGASDFDSAGRATDTKSWRAQTTKWFKDNYPDAEINSIYAAIGESGTFLGTYIVQDYVIAKKPDLVFLEYAINDTYGGFDKTRAALQCETIVREIKEALPQCDIVVLITGDGNTKNNYTWFYPTAEGHAEIAEAYNLPLVFMGRALADYVDGNSLNWSDYYKDNVHPIDAGYAYYFSVVKEYLNNSLIAEVLPAEALPADTLPELVSDHLLDGDRHLVYATSDILTGNSAWMYYANVNINPVFSKNGSIGAPVVSEPTFTYTFSGTDLSVYTNIYSPSKYIYTIDGGEEQTGTFSGHNPTTIVEGLEAGTHTITIKPVASTISGITTMYIDAVLYRDASQQTEKQ